MVGREMSLRESKRTLEKTELVSSTVVARLGLEGSLTRSTGELVEEGSTKDHRGKEGRSEEKRDEGQLR